MSARTRQDRFRVLILRDTENDWVVWGRYSSNAQRTYGDAVWLAARPDISDVRIEHTTVTTESLTAEELLAHLVDTPSPVRPATGEPTP